MSILQIKNLVHKYITVGDTEEENLEITAIDDIDISVEKGEFIAILGKNGSGKSSLAKHINGLLMPTSGTVYVKGMDTKDRKNLLKIRQSAGIVFQNPDNQIVGTIVEEDVAFGPENMGASVEDIWKRVTRALEGVGMTAYKEASPNHLSGGQKQRVAIAGIMAMEPECIILDEPTAMLDPKGREHVLSLVKELNQEKNITIIMVTHHMEEVLFANRIIVMDHGKIAMDGTSKEVFPHVEKMKELGLEVPYATELSYELRKEGVPLSDTITTREELVEELCQLI
ncbi:energy-coupling factor transporter ATPase [Anaerostipes sp.]|uniref:energy-coupling factor transporter ATPase n=1 Tax=Anaerostipes sp. TaxID=1872530 RepID=UPI00258A4F4B|nr:energy-coupling factor transporter ATPase [Anaerostipes sp.]MCI5622901.1 energy-coupling factor transporter ATPase [Anaerostipes sp.]MDY2726641.1 energy-coupling factor transporter ATPase [Anaerostipes faecalis]